MSRFRLAAVGILSLAAAAACSDAPTDPRAVAASPTAPSAQAGRDEVVPGEVLVKFRSGVSRVMVGEVTKSHGLVHAFQGMGGAYEAVKTARGNEYAAAAALADDPNVEWAEPNYIRHPMAVSPRMWAFANPGGMNMKFNELDTSGRYGQSLPSTYAAVADADVDANFTVTCLVASCPDVVIGNIDTGVDYNNPELAGRVILGKDWVSNDNDPMDTSNEGHGTHTAGTSAGVGTSAVGVTGISSHVKFYAQRVCGPSGCPVSAIINALNAAASYRDANGKPMVAVNVSLGGGTESTGEKNAIAALTANGTLVIASAGNDGRSKVNCPACDVNAVSVAATTWRDARASYSTYGSGLDLSAPGGECYSNTTEDGCIFSSIMTGYTGGHVYSASATADPIYNINGNLPLANGYYAYMEGTSMAAPNVTSAAAVVAWATGLRGSALRTRLQSTADHIGGGSTWPNNNFGNGRINVYRAVNNSATSPL
jgi:hypothetical protein